MMKDEMAEHAACIGHKGKAYKIMVAKCE